MRLNKKGEKKDVGLVTISSLFDKYKKTLIAPEKTVTQTFIEIVKDLYQWDIDSEAVHYNPNSKILNFSGSSILKTEIKLHKREILTHLKGRLGPKSAPKDIL